MSKVLKWDDLQFEREIGKGHAGSVWLAKLVRPALGLHRGTKLAVKRYYHWILKQPGQYNRIFRELSTSAEIKHPNIVRSYCFVSDPDGLPALVMQYYRGKTLEEHLAGLRKQKKCIPLDDAFKIIGELCSAVAKLHKSGLIHRDIKPANIILGVRTRPVLMDLGVVSSAHFAEATATDEFLGTIRYAAPEYLFDGKCDKKADVYSLGAIACELFLGKRFFAHVGHWAKLVVERDKAQYSGDGEYPRLEPTLFVSFERKYGIHSAEAIRFILETFLTSWGIRQVNLDVFATVVKKQFWKRPFYAAIDGCIMEGEPPLVKYISMDLFEKDKYSLKEAAEHLKELAGRSRASLIRVIEKYHWNEGIPIIKNRYWEKWVEEGIIDAMDFIIEGEPEETIYGIHPTVQALYRYGYLKKES